MPKRVASPEGPQGKREKIEPPHTSISVILRKTFKAYTLSPLYKFDLTAESLHKYGLDLGRGVQSLRQDLPSQPSGDKPQIRTKFEILDSGVGSIDPSILISIVPYNEFGGITEDVGRPILLGVLLCVAKQNRANFGSYPLLLLKGPKPWTAKVLNWINTYDGHPNALSLRSTDLQKLVTDFAKSTQVPLALLYELPSSIQGIRTVSINIPPESVNDVATAVGEDTELLKSIHTHIMAHFQFDMGSMALIRVGMSAGMVQVDGRVKLLSEGGDLFKFLRQITTT